MGQGHFQPWRHRHPSINATFHEVKQAVAITAFNARHIDKAKTRPFQATRQKIGVKRSVDQRYALSREIGGGTDRAVAPHKDCAIGGPRCGSGDIDCRKPARIRFNGRRRTGAAEMDVALFQKRRRIAPFAIGHEFRIKLLESAGPEPGEP